MCCLSLFPAIVIKIERTSGQALENDFDEEKKKEKKINILKLDNIESKENKRKYLARRL
jgi:hypothetical protein